ncbi:hypothetical protein BS17DRAFT_785543 [Gyrodon lividus]|nr:hypothetical protein BS17DRAFT_785543 [Gyrodon lividus]
MPAHRAHVCRSKVQKLRNEQKIQDATPPPNAIAGPSTLAPFSSHNQIHASSSAVPYQHYPPMDFNYESCNYSSATTTPHPYYSTDTYLYHSYQ